MAPDTMTTPDPGLAVRFNVQGTGCAVLIDALIGGVDMKNITQPIHAAELAMHKLDPAVLAQAKALAFFELTKGGLIVTMTEGRGFLIRKNAGGWSAPVVFTLSEWGVGTAMGLTDQTVLMVINDESTIDAMLAGSKYKLSADVLLPSGTELQPGGSGSQVFAMSHGTLLFNLSLNGTCLEVDSEAMERVYGKGKTPAEVLASAPRPVEMAKLYTKLEAPPAH